MLRDFKTCSLRYNGMATAKMVRTFTEIKGYKTAAFRDDPNFAKKYQQLSMVAITSLVRSWFV